MLFNDLKILLFECINNQKNGIIVYKLHSNFMLESLVIGFVKMRKYTIIPDYQIGTSSEVHAPLQDNIV